MVDRKREMEGGPNELFSGLKKNLEKIPGFVSISEIKVRGKIIDSAVFESQTLGILKIQRARVEDAASLFEFYSDGLSEEAKNFFPPYPLFSPPVNSIAELSHRIEEWGKEPDWTVLMLVKGDEVIGISLLKRFDTERPVSGLAVRERFRKLKLGFLLQTIINEQADLLELPRLYATASPDNAASLGLHKTCGFTETGRRIPHFVTRDGIKEVDRNDVEMVRELR